MPASAGPHAARVAARRARARKANELANRGLDARAIAGKLNGSRFTIYSYLADPPNERNRRLKHSYRGRCQRCGTLTSGGDGPDRARTHCPACAARPRCWTSAQIVKALIAWHQQVGRWPSSHELEHARMRAVDDWRSEVLATAMFPSARSCARRFGTYTAAIAAAEHALGRPNRASRAAPDR
jgi:hypothetical protein